LSLNERSSARYSRYTAAGSGYSPGIARDERKGFMQGFQVFTSDDCKFGEVVGVEGDHLIVEHGTLRKSKYAVPETFAHTDDGERVVRLSVSKEIVESSPKLENGSIDRTAVAAHYGLAEGTAAPDTEGYGDVLPDDPARSAVEQELRTGIQPADQQRAEMRESGSGGGGDQDKLGTPPETLDARRVRR
jgi:hypothetical protein